MQADMRLQVAAKVVGRLRGEEFPHFGAAYRARSAWVRRHYTPAASVLVGAMLHDADSPFRPATNYPSRSLSAILRILRVAASRLIFDRHCTVVRAAQICFRKPDVEAERSSPERTARKPSEQGCFARLREMLRSRISLVQRSKRLERTSCNRAEKWLEARRVQDVIVSRFPSLSSPSGRPLSPSLPSLPPPPPPTLTTRSLASTSPQPLLHRRTLTFSTSDSFLLLPRSSPRWRGRLPPPPLDRDSAGPARAALAVPSRDLHWRRYSRSHPDRRRFRNSVTFIHRTVRRIRIFRKRSERS